MKEDKKDHYVRHPGEMAPPPVTLRYFVLRTLRCFTALTLVVAGLLVASGWSRICGWITIPLIFPGFFFLADEWEPKLGFWGARLAGWIFSFPATFVLAFVLSSISLLIQNLNKRGPRYPL